MAVVFQDATLLIGPLLLAAVLLAPALKGNAPFRQIAVVVEWARKASWTVDVLFAASSRIGLSWRRILVPVLLLLVIGLAVQPSYLVLYQGEEFNPTSALSRFISMANFIITVGIHCWILRALTTASAAMELSLRQLAWLACAFVLLGLFSYVFGVLSNLLSFLFASAYLSGIASLLDIGWGALAALSIYLAVFMAFCAALLPVPSMLAGSSLTWRFFNQTRLLMGLHMALPFVALVALLALVGLPLTKRLMVVMSGVVWASPTIPVLLLVAMIGGVTLLLGYYFLIWQLAVIAEVGHRAQALRR